MSVTVPSFAKINWNLEVLGRRTDGYHEVRTILQSVSLEDRLTFTQTDSGIELTCDMPGVPLDGTNLICRAAKLLQETAGVGGGVQIHLEKRIPIAAGLGGGSSNAAVTLLLLDRLWQTNLGSTKLVELASMLGADVPFFLTGGTALGVGRGDSIVPIADISSPNILLVNGGIAVAAGDAYRALPTELTTPYTADMMPFSLGAARVSTFDPSAVGTALRNDLEYGVLSSHSVLIEIKNRLKSLGAAKTLMSGSGSTIFGLFDSEAERTAAEGRLTNTGWWFAAVRTIGRTEYRAAIGVSNEAV